MAEWFIALHLKCNEGNLRRFKSCSTRIRVGEEGRSPSVRKDTLVGFKRGGTLQFTGTS